MKKMFITALVMFLGLWAGNVFAANSDTATINYEVQAINEVNIDDASETLTVNAATAGSQPTAATDSGTYDITTNCAANAKKLTAAIASDMPTGVTLTMNVTAPTGASSAGAVTLSHTAADVVTSVDPVAETNIAISYSMSATVAAGVLSSSSRVLTLTLTDS